MASKHYWIKLYVKMLDDPKIGELPDGLFRQYIEFLLVAKEVNRGGELPSIDALAWRIRQSEKSVSDALHTLENINLVRNDGTVWIVTPLKEILFSKYKYRRKEWMLRRRILTQIIFYRDGKVCARCGATEDLTIDHIVAIVNGGSDELTNLQVLCRSCNAQKGAKV